MTTTYRVKLIREGNTQSLILPQEFISSTTEFTLTQEEDRLILEPVKPKSLLELLSTWDDLDEDFPDVDEGLFPSEN